MSIQPLGYNEDTKIYTMYHEEEQHQFDTLLNDMVFIGDAGDFFTVNCLVCGGASIHPASGGAAPPDIQLLHSRLLSVKDCSCGLLPAGKSEVLCLSHSKLHSSQLDGIDRWQVEKNAGPTLSISVETASSYIVGLGPFEGQVDEGYSVENVLVKYLEIALGNRYTQFDKETGEVRIAGRKDAT